MVCFRSAFLVLVVCVDSNAVLFDGLTLYALSSYCSLVLTQGILAAEGVGLIVMIHAFFKFDLGI